MTSSEILIIDSDLSKVIEFDADGFTDEQRKLLRTYISAMENGDIDTISFQPSDELDFKKSTEIVNNEIDAAHKQVGFNPEDQALSVTGRPYVSVHIDRRHVEADDKTPVLRLHISEGSHIHTPNIPADADPRNYEAMFLLGRNTSSGDMDQQISLADLTPSVIIGQTNPSWTLFRISGFRLNADAPGVAHAVLPRRAVEIGMSPDAEFSEIDFGEPQVVSSGDETHVVSDGIKNNGFERVSPDSLEYVGVERDFRIRDFSRSYLEGL